MRESMQLRNGVRTYRPIRLQVRVDAVLFLVFDLAIYKVHISHRAHNTRRSCDNT